jgi:signal transduction histidine kinase/CheY-like chemotaxis protein
MRDITERRRAHATLRQSLSLLRATLESTADGILVVDLAGQIVIFNQKFADLWGCRTRSSTRERCCRAGGHCRQPSGPRCLHAPGACDLQPPDDESLDVVELKNGRVFERYSQPQRIAGATVGRVWSFRDVTERRRAERTLEDIAGKLINAQEEERSRIGRELHDHVSQQLALMAIRLDQLRADHSTSEDVATRLGRLRQDTSEIIEDVYRISHRLHSSMLEQLGLVRALQRLVLEFSERHDIPIEFTSAPLSRPVSQESALCLFRVVEEALTNVAKHSRARSARVDVEAVDDGIRIAVEDGGVGFDLATFEKVASLGLISMRSACGSYGERFASSRRQTRAPGSRPGPHGRRIRNGRKMKRARILLADDHTLMAEALQHLLQTEFEVVETVRDGRALVEAVSRLEPDLVVADIAMPLLNGLDAGDQIRAAMPRVKIVYLTQHRDPRYAAEAMRRPRRRLRAEGSRGI